MSEVGLTLRGRPTLALLFSQLRHTLTHNDLIRQLFPKRNCFAQLTDEEVALVQNKPNTHPRKCIDYATPNDIFIASSAIAMAA